MRRKSDRNKSKSSPEKKTERATRKSTRRTGKHATSSSPERDETEEKPIDEAKTQANICKETKPQQLSTRSRSKEVKSTVQEEVPVVQAVATTELETIKEKIEEGEETSVVWKVARADASPGEIQKLKLCRQRNPSEASDSSSSKKKLHKWYESGEGDGEEVDSAEERPRSLKSDIRSTQPDDTPSSILGQDSKEEVSDNKEILSKTTSANLSDDKPNVDQLAAASEACGSDITDCSKKLVESNHDHVEANSNGDDFKKMIGKTDIPEESEKPKEIAEVVQTKDDNESATRAEECTTATEDNAETLAENHAVNTKSNESGVSKEISKEGAELPGGSENESNSSAKNLESKLPPRGNRRKHRAKYHDSSDSETPDSEEEMALEPTIEEPKSQVELAAAERTEGEEQNPDSHLSNNRLHSPAAENVTTTDTCSKDEKRTDVDVNDGRLADEFSNTSQVFTCKPAKVNLKRSFSTRTIELEKTKKEDVEKNGVSQTSPQDKPEDQASVDEIEKNIPRKRRWGTTVLKEITPATFAVSTDSLKVLVPEAKPLSVTEVRLSKDDDSENERRRDRDDQRSTSDDVRDQNCVDDLPKTESSRKAAAKNDNHIGAKRKISILKEAAIAKSPTPPAAKPTNVLLIKNLVRPFTLNQIKELLSRTGTIVENGFWIDGIKSKCYVVYANEDQAFETRQALHGISWPLSNPKRLHVEYSNLEDVKLARESAKEQPVQRKTDPLTATDAWQQVWTRDEKLNVGTKAVAVREWDLGKEDDNQGKDKERERKDLEKKRRPRSRSPSLEAHLPPPARKFKKKEEEPPPAKLLDDLFKKTKAIPCIYWLPLTNEQIIVKEEMRRQHMAEHARRLEEMRRAERNRETAARRHRSPKK